jgi:hypothetical protein
VTGESVPREYVCAHYYFSDRTRLLTRDHR